MAQDTILPLGTTVGEASDDVVLDDGESVIVGIFVDDGESIPKDCVFGIFMDTPGEDRPEGRLAGDADIRVRLDGPGTWRFTRAAAGANGTETGLSKEQSVGSGDAA